MSVNNAWFEKYRPTSIKNMVGFKQVKKQIIQFLKEFFEFRKYEESLHLYYTDRDKLDLVRMEEMQIITSENPSFYDFSQGIRSIILIGPAGIGKTTIAKAIANDLHLQVLETNASDARGEEEIHEIMKSAISSRSLMRNMSKTKNTKGKLILFDESDGLSTAGENSGAKTLREYIKITKYPVIMTANEHTRAITTLKKVAHVIECPQPTTKQLFVLLRYIAKKEEVTYDKKALWLLCEQYSDYRSAINDFQFYIQTHGKLTKDIVVENTRDESIELEQGLEDLFHSYSIGQGKNILNSIDMGSNYMQYYYKISNEAYSLPAEENMPTVVKTLKRADKILKRIMTERDYRTLGYYFDHLASMGLFKDSETFDKELGEKIMWRARNPYNDDILTKLQKVFHVSTHEIYDSIIPILIIKFDKDTDLQKDIFERCDIKKSEWDTITKSYARRR